MKYVYKEIENAVIINGLLYEVIYGKCLYCIDCDLPFHDKCFELCHYFDSDNKFAVFKRLNDSQVFNLHNDETK